MIKREPKPSFSELFDTLDMSLPDRTPLHRRDLEIIYQYGLMANKVNGVAAEAGVFSGSSLFVLANVFDGEIHAFDSWKGLPGLSNEDQGMMSEGYFAYDVGKVKEKLSFTDKVIYHEGLFSETFFRVDRDLRFSYAFCDVDRYSSVNECFNFFYPRMTPGGVLIFDDYFCLHTPGAKAAIDEMFVTYGVASAHQERSFVVIEV